MAEAWRAMGLTWDEYQLITSTMGREPNEVELGIFAVMWSEHCSYKTSKSVLRLFPTSGPRVLQGPGENAGVVDIGDGQAVVFKMESHNHPSAIEPLQGAATGVGGIIRDIFTMGARPIALMNSLRFGPLEDSRVRYLFGGVVEGIAWYGNCIGIPTVGGEIYFDPVYSGNPLVNVMCLGIIEHGRLARGVAKGIGNPVMVVGARTGRDGIHGATFASEELSEASAARRPAVQVGDPFMEKLLVEACLELISGDYLVGMQDMGAAGLTSSSAEMASRGGSGMEIDIALVPRRETAMTPYEVMLSESQERMLVVPRSGCEEQVKEIFHRWGLEATVVGRVTGDDLLRIFEGDKVVAEIPVKALNDMCPPRSQEESEPAYFEETRSFDQAGLPDPPNLGGVLLDLLSSPTLAGKEWVYRQYDYQVQINTVSGPGAGAAVLRVKGSSKGLAITTDGNGRYVYLDPYRGGATTVAEAARNLVCVGAEPLALTDCLNFGNPEKPAVFWQFRRAVEGMSAACRVLGTPVVSGNVSFYNESEGQAIYPTPVVGMVGLLSDINAAVTPWFKNSGDRVVLLGETLGELGGSEYLARIHGLVSGEPPVLDLERERAVQDLCLKVIRKGLVTAAHDCSEGGLAVTLAEMCPPGLGADLNLKTSLRPHEELFGETQSRIVITIPPGALEELLGMAAGAGVPCFDLGAVGGDKLAISLNGTNVLAIETSRLDKARREAIPCHMTT